MKVIRFPHATHPDDPLGRSRRSLSPYLLSFRRRSRGAMADKPTGRQFSIYTVAESSPRRLSPAAPDGHRKRPCAVELAGADHRCTCGGRAEAWHWLGPAVLGVDGRPLVRAAHHRRRTPPACELGGLSDFVRDAKRPDGRALA